MHVTVPPAALSAPRPGRVKQLDSRYPACALPQWLAEVHRSQGLLGKAVLAYRRSLKLASQLGVRSGQVASLLRLALLALRPCMVSETELNQLQLSRKQESPVLTVGLDWAARRGSRRGSRAAGGQT